MSGCVSGKLMAARVRLVPARCASHASARGDDATPFAPLVQRFDRMLLRQRRRPCNTRTRWDRAVAPSPRPNCRSARQSAGRDPQIIQALLDDLTVRRMQMVRVGVNLPGSAAHARRCFPALVEHPQQPGLPAPQTCRPTYSGGAE